MKIQRFDAQKAGFFSKFQKHGSCAGLMQIGQFNSGVVVESVSTFKIIFLLLGLPVSSNLDEELAHYLSQKPNL